jgi:outer membrane biosynthesis protein TonB
MATPDAAPVVEEVVVASEAVEEAKPEDEEEEEEEEEAEKAPKEKKVKALKEKKPKKPKATKAAKAAKLPTTHPSYLLVILSLSLSLPPLILLLSFTTAHTQHMCNTCTTP